MMCCKRVGLAALCAALLFSYQASADDLSNTYHDCVKQAEQHAGALLGCMQAEYRYQKNQMAVEYSEALMRLSERKQKHVQQDQPLWDISIDASCKPYAQVMGGVEAEVQSLACYAHAYASRAKMLRNMR